MSPPMATNTDLSQDSGNSKDSKDGKASNPHLVHLPPLVPIKFSTSSPSRDLPGQSTSTIPSGSSVHNIIPSKRNTIFTPITSRLQHAAASIDFENQLAKLDSETVDDDLVYNSLGSFETPPTLPPVIPEVEPSQPRGLQYTVRSAKIRDSADYHRYIRKFDQNEDIRSDLENIVQNSILQDAGSGSDDVTLPSRDAVDAFLEANKIRQTSNITSRSDISDNQFDSTTKSVELNGMVGGGSQHSRGGDHLTVKSQNHHIDRHNRNAIKKHHATHDIIHGLLDPGVLRAELLSAVELNKVDKVKAILNSGVDPNAICDEKGRWPLHISCLLGLPHITKILLDHGAEKDQPDAALERTPLMYAGATSKEIVQILLHHRADFHAKNKFLASALHYAAGAGQGECCRILALAGCDVNGRDRQKMTPLLMAARVNDVWSIDTLLEFGADVHAQDAIGKNGLHYAAETSEGMDLDFGKMGATFRKLVVAGVNVNAVDHNGKSPLYYAIQTGSVEAVMILSELGAELLDGMSLLTMSKKFPNAIPTFLDKCVSSNIDNTDPESKLFYIQFDYTCLTVFPKDTTNDKLLSLQGREETESILREMGVLHGLTRCKDTSILSHPVCESLLRLKWIKVKWYLYLDMLLFAIFLAFLTAVIFMEYESESPEEIDGDLVNNSTFESEGFRSDSEAGLQQKSLSHDRHCMDSTRNIVVWSILWVLTALLACREMIQLVQAPLHYVVQVDNILELVLLSSVALLSLAECGIQSFVEARDHFAAVCLIVGWTIQVTLYGKLGLFFGVYIRMFAAVAVNILKCMFTYLGLLFAFSLTLHFLFRSQKDFDSVGFTFLKTFAMMIGEVDLVRTFIDAKSKDAVIVPFTSHLVVGLFIVFISIILSSLFIALAVCDINSLQREGEYMQLVQQIKVSSQLEDALQKRSLLYPQYGMRDHRSQHQRKGVIFPNLKDHGKLSKDALEIVISRHAKRLDSSHSGITQSLLSDYNPNPMGGGSSDKMTADAFDQISKQIKVGIDKCATDMDSRMLQIIQDVRAQSSNQLSREILLIRSQLEDMNTCLREMSVLLMNTSDKMLKDSVSPVQPKRKITREPTQSAIPSPQTITTPEPRPEPHAKRPAKSGKPRKPATTVKPTMVSPPQVAKAVTDKSSPPVTDPVPSTTTDSLADDLSAVTSLESLVPTIPSADTTIPDQVE